MTCGNSNCQEVWKSVRKQRKYGISYCSVGMKLQGLEQRPHEKVHAMLLGRMCSLGGMSESSPAGTYPSSSGISVYSNPPG